MSIFTKILGDTNEKALKKLEPLIKKINQLESKFEGFSDEELKNKTKEFKERLKNSPEKEREILDEILPEAFALVREAAKRTLKSRHFDVQLLGGIVMHQGKIAEMKTGEGKTSYAANLAIYLNALTGKGVHVVTVNDYLTRRDANWIGPVYHLLGLTCACITHQKAYLFEPQANPDQNENTVEMENLRQIPRKEAYLADITYGTNNEFGFDYLRDNMAPSLELMVQRKSCFALIDEVDSILIDEARTPLIISAPDADSTKLYGRFAELVPRLKENIDYNIDEKMRVATLTETGIAKVEKILGLGNIYQEGGIRYVHHLEQALRAQVLFKKDKNYVVKNNQVIIVDEFTGRLMPGRRYSEGLHQALEAKENVSVQQESRTLASITFQNYFRMYPKLAGMTGTAVTSAEEFHKVYGLDVVVIPTNKPMMRENLSDLVYKNEKAKFEAIIEKVKEKHEKGQPVLIGTVSIEKNELLSSYFKKAGIPHQILNAKNHEQEAQVIAQAGKYGAVTLATNMAGRGVDIVLGGKNEENVINQEEHEKVIQAEGLHVIGTERHEARRIDDQLRGRAGRQGDPGSSQFFVSLEDDLMRIFGGEKVKSMMEMLKIPEGQPIENKLISKAVASAQARIEGHNFDIRKHVLEYDDVLNKQREVIYDKRQKFLKKENLKDDILEMIRGQIKRVVQFHTQSPHSEEWNLEEISEIIKSIFQAPDDLHQRIRDFKTSEQIFNYLIELAETTYQNREKALKEHIRHIEKLVVLRALDGLWMEHLDNMGYLRDSVRLRAYGQKDPLVEYKNEGKRLFGQLLSALESMVVNMIYKVSLMPAASSHPETSGVAKDLSSSQEKKLGRNDPCPCGSGKKYKKCCYPKYGR